MSEHTPGPWTVLPHSGVVGQGIMVETGDRPHPWVLCLKINGRTNEERETNARLIAAAPELLAALEALAGELSAHAVARKPEVRELLRRAQAALDLAGGRNDD